ncbi:aminopeptidase [Pantoea alhagi]|uniref:Aminopeptidase n=1 Tax=Pantoea alhagi TaxID=1891675 RepID=A0A1W6B676_9GAMM|nr:aminopeptidase [Pantoea alhagi]ARJ42600.1 aminopeptidase [Pantoea alhagi]
MFSLLRLSALAALLSCGISLPVSASTPVPGQFAEQQLRHIATWFPGRMAGSPAELLTANYLQQQFEEMGYKSDKRDFKTRAPWRDNSGKTHWRNLTATSVIAARAGEVPQEILVIAHLDTWRPVSEEETGKDIGGLRLQGVDDNASGLGVMLELAQQLSHKPLHYGVRFVALSAHQDDLHGMDAYIARMKANDRKNTLLVIDLDSLIVGDRLYFNSGKNTASAVIKQTRDRALDIAHRYGINAATRPAHSAPYPLPNAFDAAGFPLLTVRAANWDLGKKDGTQQRNMSRHFPQGISHHQTARDNLNYLDRWLPGRISARARDSVRILFPLINELANPPATNKES